MGMVEALFRISGTSSGFKLLSKPLQFEEMERLWVCDEAQTGVEDERNRVQLV
jgi:hypothetical protein